MTKALIVGWIIWAGVAVYMAFGHPPVWVVAVGQTYVLVLGITTGFAIRRWQIRRQE